MINKTEILYPIFLSLAAQMQSDDRFYRFLYEDMAYGKSLPYGIYIQDNYLVCYRKNREFSLKLIDDEKILQEIHSLLKNRACVLSEKDNIKKIDKYLKNDNTNEKYKNKKSYRDNLIQNYILRKGEKYKINVNKLKKLLKLINNGLLFKIISSNDFTFEKNQSIEDIKGIYFSDRCIEVDPSCFLNLLHHRLLVIIAFLLIIVHFLMTMKIVIIFQVKLLLLANYGNCSPKNFI